ncbi:uncharacterized protein K441DRAFT_678926 [Cenococcum geophilum 1.58]|uniref:uncharacterized protein n=1 Tax=Cenococcum geophilum 1.58 TaxID=794803 RepID=UPI00358F7966|nr:hypothetical protein K441DRAFT_678926 [Cenococcum geophilum 1.58]
MASSSELPEPRSSLLLQSSKRWSINHLKALRVAQQLKVPAVKLVGPAYLPTDKDKIFQQLAEEIAQPTEADLEDFKYNLCFRQHPFRPFFIEISHASWSDNTEYSSRILWNFIEELTYSVEMKRTRITWTYRRRSSMTFTIQPGGIKCAISCEGIIHPVDCTKMLPIATLIAWDSDYKIDPIAQQALQILGQGITIYTQEPGRDSYKAFVLCMQGTYLQLATATLYRTYIEELC